MEIVRRFHEHAEKQYVERITVAGIYAALDEKDKAFAELEKSFADRDCGIARLTGDPFLDPLRNDPRFKALVQRMKLPE